MSADILNIWTFLVLIMGWSYLIKETDLFHFCEYTIIGVGVAHAFNSGVEFLITKGLTPIMEGQFIYIIGFILGAMTYFRFWRKFAWLIRYPLGIMTGTYIGLSIRGIVQASILRPIIGTIEPLFSLTGTDAINHVILIIFLVGVMWYFVFSKRLSLSPSPYKYVALIGRVGIILVMAFYLATDFLSQQNSIFARVEFVLNDFINSLSSLLGG